MKGGTCLPTDKITSCTVLDDRGNVSMKALTSGVWYETQHLTGLQRRSYTARTSCDLGICKTKRFEREAHHKDIQATQILTTSTTAILHVHSDSRLRLGHESVACLLDSV